MIRPATSNDIPSMKQLLSTIELFPPEMLEAQMEGYLNDKDSKDLWYIHESNEVVIGFCYSASEQLTDNTYNLIAVGVRKDQQGKGIGKSLMTYVESELSKIGGRILIVDTSGTDDFVLTRKFYKDLGYTKEAVIRDYWAEGDDKVTFWKRLS